MKRILALLFLTVPVIALFACGKERDPGSAPTSAQAPRAAAAIAAAPWLRERLPPDTIAYVRIPGPWALLAAANERHADRMYASPGHVQAVAAIRKALSEIELFGRFDPDATIADVRLRAINAISGPIELAVISPGGVATPMAQVFATVPLDSNDPDRVGAYVRALAGDRADDGPLFDQDGFGRLPADGLPGPVLLRFDAAGTRLHLLSGMNATGEQLRTIVDRLDRTGTHAMHTLEQEIDRGGQGLFAWLDVQAVKPFAMMTLTPDRLWLRDVYEHTRAVALGWGGVDGHGHLGLRAEILDPTWAGYLPQAPRVLDIGVSGEPDTVLTLALPVAEEIEAALAMVRGSQPALAEGFDAIDATMRSASGLGLIDWLRPFGPELAWFNDAAGDFTAIRLRDRDAWQLLLAQIEQRGGQYHRQRVGAATVHHLAMRLPALFDGAGNDADAGSPGERLLDWWQNLPSHVYWVESGGWLLFANVPQPLIDRAALGSDQPLRRWLEERQGSDRGQALVSISGQARHLSRWTYHIYLSLLAALGDAADAPVDLFDLPTAHQLGLPTMTGVGMEVVVSPTRVGIDFNYQHSIVDAAFSSGGYGLIASAGILSAIAVPAYQDYLARSQVAAALAGSAGLKLQLAEYYASHGDLLTDDADLHLPDATATGPAARVEFDHGAIAIVFNDSASTGLKGRYLYLLPYDDGHGQLGFACADAPLPEGASGLLAMHEGIVATDIDGKHLPSQCQGARR